MAAIDQDIVERLNGAAEWFANREAEIAEACKTARTNLRANNVLLKGTFPWTRVNEPWFVKPRPWPELSEDQKQVLEDSRHFGLRSHVFGLALKFLLQAMQRNGLAYPQFQWQHIRLRNVCSYRVMAVQHEFAAVHIVNGKNVSLTSIATRFDYAPNMQAARLLEPLLFPMTDLGLWRARANETYAIGMGAVGAAFHSTVFLPVLREFERKMGEE